MANPGDPSRRPTKAERKESARLEREKIQQQMSARNRNRRIGLVLIALALVTVVVVAFVVKPGSEAIASPASLLDDAASAAQTAGCGAVQETPNYQNLPGKDPDTDHAHIGDTLIPTPPPLSNYATIPPASGPHDINPATPGVYDRPPDIYRSIHALEHAGAIVWYAPEAADTDEVKAIRAFYNQPDKNVGQGKVIVAPYDFPDQGEQGSLPEGVQMALVAWHRLQTCAQPSLAVAFDFTSQYSNAYPDREYIGVAREPRGVM